MKKIILTAITTILIAAGLAFGTGSPASAATAFCQERAVAHFQQHGTGPNVPPLVCFDIGVNQINIWSQYGGYYGGMTPNVGFYTDASSGVSTSGAWWLWSSTATAFSSGWVTTNTPQLSGLNHIRVSNAILHDELEWFAGGNAWFRFGNNPWNP